MEAIKQGSACVGVRSKDFVVIATLKRSMAELSSYMKKIFKVDDHIGIGVSGLVSDARVLRKYMIQGTAFIVRWCVVFSSSFSQSNCVDCGCRVHELQVCLRHSHAYRSSCQRYQR